MKNHFGILKIKVKYIKNVLCFQKSDSEIKLMQFDPKDTFFKKKKKKFACCFSEFMGIKRKM